MSDQLPPNVRAEAAGKVGELLERFGVNPWRHALRLGLVDAVAEVLAEQVGCEHLDGPYRKVLAERDALKARVVELEAALRVIANDVYAPVTSVARAVLSATPTESEA